MHPLDDVLCLESIKKVMGILGGKWVFFIIGELHSGAKHFNELGRNLGIGPRSLSDA